MELDIKMMGDVVSIVLKGRIDANTAPVIEQKLLSLISEGTNYSPDPGGVGLGSRYGGRNMDQP